ncbi:MAG: CotH kinase family protein [Pseudomonadota bacterium]
MLAQAKDEVYAPAGVRFEGAALGTIGIRFKGSIGTLSSCFDSQGKLVCPKLSMKLGFDEYAAATRFFGLKRLNLHSMVWDDTKLHERLAYDMFREAGIIAPRSAWAVLRVNGRSLGLFSMVEQVDGRFTKNRWPAQGDGNLYKEAWPLSDNAGDYQEHLETDALTPAAAAHTAFVEFHADLNANPEAGAQRSALARWMDLDYLATYMAVDDAVNNLDGVTATYTGGDPRRYDNHNFYVYLEQDRDFFWLIPWDTDATFNLRGDFEVVPRWNSATPDCSRSYPVWGNARVVSPACDPVFRALAADPTAYRAAVDALLAGPFSEQTLGQTIDRHAAFIASAVGADPTGPGLASWKATLASWKQRLPLFRQHLTRARDGQSNKPLALSPVASNGFEDQDAYSTALGALPLANPHSIVGLSLSTEDALSERQDLRLDFEYRNEGVPPANPYGQWIYFLLRFDAAPTSLEGRTGLRMRLRSDKVRTVRIDVESGLYQASNEGIKFGWEVIVRPEPSVVEVRFDKAALPAWAHATTDTLPNIIAHAEGVTFHPFCAGRDAGGFLPDGTTDAGFLRIDDVQVF